MNTQKQSFAFKLADKAAADSKAALKWSVRDNVSVAGCTMRAGDARESRRGAIDAGEFC